jgi:hypothetical protein
MRCWRGLWVTAEKGSDRNHEGHEVGEAHEGIVI